MPKRKLKGVVVSDKMTGTVVVKTERIKQHSKYKKRFRVYDKYKADYKGESLKVGDKVLIEECRPISKDKTWRVVNHTTRNIKHGT